MSSSTTKKPSFELDLEEIKGEIKDFASVDKSAKSISPIEPVIRKRRQKKVTAPETTDKIPIPPLPPVSSFRTDEEVVASLEAKAKNKTWLPIPVYDDETGEKVGDDVKDIADCTAEEFVRWMCSVFPVARKDKIDLKDYTTTSAREKAFIGIVSLSQLFKFPPAGLVDTVKKLK